MTASREERRGQGETRCALYPGYGCVHKTRALIAPLRRRRYFYRPFQALRAWSGKYPLIGFISGCRGNTVVHMGVFAYLKYSNVNSVLHRALYRLS